MISLHSIRLIVAAFVYCTAISLGAGILLTTPVRALLIIPLITGVVLLGHAIQTTNLDELGYATIWLWAAVLALSVAGTITEEFMIQGDVAPLAEISVARVLGTFSLITVLIAAYMRGIQTAAQKETRASATA